MRKAQVSISLALIVMAAMVQVFAAPEKPESSLTGTDFARELAATARAVGSTDLSRALLNPDLGGRGKAPLTEEIAVTIMKAAGFPAATSYPDRLLTRERADALVRQFKASLVIPQASRAAGGAGNAELPGGLDACLVSKNHGKCVDCCKELGGGASTCAKACLVINKPSSSEPLP